MRDMGHMVGRISEKMSRAGWLHGKRLRQQFASGLNSALEDRVVLVAGVQRSGTNMIMDMLERNRATEVFHEIDQRAFERYELRDQSVLDELVRRSPAPVVVFKALCECQDIARLLAAFRSARCIWAVRRYEDVVASHVRKWTGMPDSIAQIAARDDATAGWRGRGMSRSTRELVRRLYHPGLSNASACGLFWYFRNILYFEQGLDTDPAVRLVSYDHLIATPTAAARELFGFLGLTFTPSVCEFVAPPGAVKQKQAADLDIDEPIRKVCEELQRRLWSTFENKELESRRAWPLSKLV